MSADFGPLGLVVGHATDDVGATGCTVILRARGPMRCGSALLGRATGGRELAVATPFHAAEAVDAVLLTGGSAWGLDAAGGVMRWMEERGRGFPIAGGVVPLVPAAVVFDLAPLGRFSARPSPEMAWMACESAGPVPTEGSIGAGTGTTVGKVAGFARAMKGGLGTAMVRSGDLVAGAVAVVNAFGDVRGATGRILAGARGDDGGFMDAREILERGEKPQAGERAAALGNTTIALVATNADLTRVALSHLAAASAAALYRRVTPAGTSVDGDTIFAVGPIDGGPTAIPLVLEAMVTHALETAIERAVLTARGRDGIPGLADASPMETTR